MHASSLQAPRCWRVSITSTLVGHQKVVRFSMVILENNRVTAPINLLSRDRAVIRARARVGMQYKG
jgi:hypothetical protein